MHAALHPFWRPQRLAGAVATLTAMALLAIVPFHPVQLAATPAPDVVEFATIKPDVAPQNPPPRAPLQKIDLPLPVAEVNLPEFEKPAVSLALPSLAPITSLDAVAPPSGNEILFGEMNGTGRANGVGSVMKPPIRRISADSHLRTSRRSRSDRVTSLNFCVTEIGSVRDVQLAVTSGFDDMDTAAAKWLERQRFKPGTLDGAAVRMCATYDVRWTYSEATQTQVRAAAEAHAAIVRARSRYPRQFVPWPYDRPFPGCDAVDICRKDG